MNKYIERIFLVMALVLALLPIKVSAQESYTLYLHSEALSKNPEKSQEFILKNLRTGKETPIVMKETQYELTLEKGDYELVETKPPKGYLPVGKPIKFTIPFMDKDGNVLDKLTLEIKSEEDLKKVLIKKLDSRTHRTLEGAVFDLYKDGKLLKEGLRTDSKGEIFLENMQLGSYRLVEKSPPKGYRILESEISFILDENSPTTPKLIQVYNEKEGPHRPPGPGEEPPGPGEEPPRPEEEPPRLEEEPLEGSPPSQGGGVEEVGNEQDEKPSKPQTSDELNYPLILGSLLLVVASIGLIVTGRKKEDK